MKDCACKAIRCQTHSYATVDQCIIRLLARAIIDCPVTTTRTRRFSLTHLEEALSLLHLDSDVHSRTRGHRRRLNRETTLIAVPTLVTVSYDVEVALCDVCLLYRQEAERSHGRFKSDI